MKYIYQRKAIKLAKDLFDNQFGSWKECLKEAHYTLKNLTTKLITAIKKNGRTTKRVVASWSEFHVVKGTGKKAKAGLKLFTDVAKLVAGKNYYTFSTYNVVSIF